MPKTKTRFSVKSALSGLLIALMLLSLLPVSALAEDPAEEEAPAEQLAEEVPAEISAEEPAEAPTEESPTEEAFTEETPAEEAPAEPIEEAAEETPEEASEETAGELLAENPAETPEENAEAPTEGAETVSNVPYISPVDEDGYMLSTPESKIRTSCTVVTDKDTDWAAGWYVVNSNVTIAGSVTCSGKVNLILADGCTLTVNGGIGITSDYLGNCSFTVWGQTVGTGTLATNGGTGAAGIGAAQSSAPTVTINGGTVTANGGAGAAGISGGYIHINGGTVTANGGKRADSSSGGGAGIGGSNGAAGGSIFINGGTVTATGYDGGAGIGGGHSGSGSNIRINGGSVTANGTKGTGGDIGAGIGGGSGGTGSYIYINGGTVNATSGTTNTSGGAGIGGGENAPGSNITISGGTVTATANGSIGGAGIGGGIGGAGSYITISGGTVTATGGNGAGIGGGKDSTGSYITISGGTVTATSNYYGAGIGGGIQGSGTDITVSGGTVTATGGQGAAGIGGGWYGSGSNIKITGGTVIARGTGNNKADEALKYADAIGSGAEAATAASGIYVDKDCYIYTERTLTNADCTLLTENNAIGTDIAASVSGKPYLFIDRSFFYKDETGQTRVAENVTRLTGGDTLTAGWYVAIGTVSAGSVTCSGDVNLILADGCDFRAAGDRTNEGRYYAGVSVTGEGNSLTIWSQNGDSGKLTATGGSYGGAGIGGAIMTDGSNITIHGGIVTATGKNGGAGIGGGYTGGADNITITGGTVTATGSTGAQESAAAGIGSSGNAACSNITITGGTVAAIGGDSNAAGIGSGHTVDTVRGPVSNIYISPCCVIYKTKTEDTYSDFVNISRVATTDISANINNHQTLYTVAHSASYKNAAGQAVSTPAAPVTAADTVWYAGWYVVDGSSDGLSGNTLTIANTVTCSGAVNLILADGYELKVNGSADKAGIAVTGEGNSFTVWGQEAETGKLTATGGSGGAGIGGGNGGEGGNITIYGGTVEAKGGTYQSVYGGAGIGGGYNRAGSNITIYGGTVTATGGSGYQNGIGNSSAAIGGGYGSNSASSSVFADPRLQLQTTANGDILCSAHYSTGNLAAELSSQNTVYTDGKLHYLDSAGAAQTKELSEVALLTQDVACTALTGWYYLDGDVSVDSLTAAGETHIILPDGRCLKAGATSGKITYYNQNTKAQGILKLKGDFFWYSAAVRTGSGGTDGDMLDLVNAASPLAGDIGKAVKNNKDILQLFVRMPQFDNANAGQLGYGKFYWSTQYSNYVCVSGTTYTPVNSDLCIVDITVADTIRLENGTAYRNEEEIDSDILEYLGLSYVGGVWTLAGDIKSEAAPALQFADESARLNASGIRALTSLSGNAIGSSGTLTVSTAVASTLTATGATAALAGDICANRDTLAWSDSAGTTSAQDENSKVSTDKAMILFTAKLRYTVTTGSLCGSTSSVAPVSGGGEYLWGDTVTLSAETVPGYTFAGWYKGDELISNNREKQLTIGTDLGLNDSEDGSVSLTAKYNAVVGGSFTLKLSGSRYTLKVDEGNARTLSDDVNREYNANSTITLTYTDTSKTFLYWVNASGNIVSTQKQYSFQLVQDTELRAVAQSSLENAAMVIFRNSSQQVLSSYWLYSTDSTDEVAFPGSAPSKAGFTFVRWYIRGTDTTATASSILAAVKAGSSKTIYVVPEYRQSTAKYIVKVGTPDGNWSEKKAQVGSTLTLTAAETYNEQAFSYWKIGSTIVSYNRSYTVFSGTETTILLTAVYGETVTAVPTVSITANELSEPTSDCKDYKADVTMQYTLPEGYTLLASGLLYSSRYNDLTVDMDGIGKYAFTGYDIYTLHLNLGENPTTRYNVCGYITYSDGTNTYTIYSSVVQTLLPEAA